MSFNSPLKKKTFAFAVRIVNLYKFLTEEKKEYVMSKQVLRSGTNPGAMVREAFNAESDKDFIHKLSIGQKEIGETIYWLELLNETNAFSELKDERKKKLENLNSLSARKQKQIEQQAVLKSRIEDGTLFNYLRDTVPNFEDTLGKVIKIKIWRY